MISEGGIKLHLNNNCLEGKIQSFDEIPAKNPKYDSRVNQVASTGKDVDSLVVFDQITRLSLLSPE
jgi:hypothetical protein